MEGTPINPLTALQNRAWKPYLTVESKRYITFIPAFKSALSRFKLRVYYNGNMGVLVTTEERHVYTAETWQQLENFLKLRT